MSWALLLVLELHKNSRKKLSLKAAITVEVAKVFTCKSSWLYTCTCTCIYTYVYNVHKNVCISVCIHVYIHVPVCLVLKEGGNEEEEREGGHSINDGSLYVVERVKLELQEDDEFLSLTKGVYIHVHCILAAG